jgi:nucleotide-binding universal stress UspA family protein
MVILAAVSGERHEDRVVKVGHDLAEAYGDELVVLHVMAEDHFREIRESEGNLTDSLMFTVDDVGMVGYVSGGRTVSDYDLEDAMADAARVADECVRNTVTPEATPVTTKGLVGEPAEEIQDEAERLDARFVVVGGRKRSPVGKAVFGSVAQAVILNTDRPVVTTTQAE